MLVHNDLAGKKDSISDITLPDIIENLTVSYYANGRLAIRINGETLYKATSGTQDFSVFIDKTPMIKVEHDN